MGIAKSMFIKLYFYWKFRSIMIFAFLLFVSGAWLQFFPHPFSILLGQNLSREHFSCSSEKSLVYLTYCYILDIIELRFHYIYGSYLYFLSYKLVCFRVNNMLPFLSGSGGFSYLYVPTRWAGMITSKYDVGIQVLNRIQNVL